jgi:hypothetical protein
VFINRIIEFGPGENPYAIKEIDTQWPNKVNVWAGMIGNHILGTFFIDGNLNRVKYMELLIMQVGPALNEVIFQHDGAPPHCVAEVTQFLNQ